MPMCTPWFDSVYAATPLQILGSTEVFGIVNSEIVKVTDENVQKEIDINTEVLK
jgi:hypothetical protein